jgi:uncharacterized protein YbbK (DUF523 family)
MALEGLPTLHVLPFCPEQIALGTPRAVPDIHGGDGVDVIERRARLIDENGKDVTDKVIAGARSMLEYALEERAELAILTDLSASCGSQVIYNGGRLVPARSFQKGVGVATALLLKEGIPVASQRDFHTLALVRQRLDPNRGTSAVRTCVITTSTLGSLSICRSPIHARDDRRARTAIMFGQAAPERPSIREHRKRIGDGRRRTPGGAVARTGQP